MDFEHIKPKFSVLNSLRDFSVLTPNTVELIRLAFNHGGYVAGGFARHVMINLDKLDSRHNSPSEISSLTSNLRGYLQNYRRVENSWSHVNRGDIDIFFPHNNNLQQFLLARVDAHVSSVTMLEPKSNRAIDFVSDKDTLVNVITGFTFPKEEQLSRFDIVNAMVAFDDDEIVVAKDWQGYEEKKQLHVVNWESIFIVSRIAKWMRKHKLSTLSPTTASLVASRALDIIKELGDRDKAWHTTSITPGILGVVGSNVTKIPAYKSYAVLQSLKALLPMLSNEQLLLLSTVYGHDAYDGAFQVLRSRSDMPIF